MKRTQPDRIAGVITLVLNQTLAEGLSAKVPREFKEVDALQPVRTGGAAVVVYDIGRERRMLDIRRGGHLQQTACSNGLNQFDSLRIHLRKNSANGLQT